MEFSAELAALTLVLVLCSSILPSLAQTNISGSAFNCPTLERSDGVPTSVHRLRPSDIAVIGAMGDSITAGFGVLSDLESIYTAFTEYRGLSWSIGEPGCQEKMCRSYRLCVGSTEWVWHVLLQLLSFGSEQGYTAQMSAC